MRSRSFAVLAAVCGPWGIFHLSASHAGTPRDIASLFAKQEALGRVGVARKTKLVDARAAGAGEIVVTRIAGEGKETQSPPAGDGDMVVRNRCTETGNEEILVKGLKFAGRYEGPIGPEASGGWAPFRPRGVDMLYFIVPEAEGSFTFTAPWGEPMTARPGDAIVRDPGDARDTYRIARAAFTCTYEISKPPAN